MKTVFKADNVPIEWEQVDVSGVETGDKHSEELFRESIASLKRNKLGLKGILHTPVERSGHQSFNVAMRQELDIYASIVLIKNIPGYKTRHDNVDLCIIRENTEGEYSGLEHQSVSGVVESLKIITRAKSERIAKFAFSFALANNRKKVTCIHKANIMKLADGMFRNTFNAVAKDYPTLETNDMIVDNASMQCVSGRSNSMSWLCPIFTEVSYLMSALLLLVAQALSQDATWAVMSQSLSLVAVTLVWISRAKIKLTQLLCFCLDPCS